MWCLTSRATNVFGCFVEKSMRQLPGKSGAVSPRLSQAKMAETGRASATIPPSARIGGRDILRRHIAPLETVSIDVTEAALEVYEAALSSACATVGLFRNHRTGAWRIEGVTPVGDDQSALVAALALAAELSGVEAPVRRMPTEAEGWLARSYASFPEQIIGRRFSVRGTHLCIPPRAGRFTLTLDAGLAFGSGEHGSTRGCIRALELVAWRHPRRILDLGTGSGILAMAAARLLHRAVLATDIEPWSICVAKQNAALNRLGRLIRIRLANGWRHPAVRAEGPYDLVLANILARPLCLMARQLALNLAPGATVILAGLLRNQVRNVLAAHLRCGLRIEADLHEGPWSTLILRRSVGKKGRTTLNVRLPQETESSNSVSKQRGSIRARRRPGRKPLPNRPLTGQYRTVGCRLSYVESI
jgi:ribosomal protein L11 methyltransferase